MPTKTRIFSRAFATAIAFLAIALPGTSSAVVITTPAITGEASILNNGNVLYAQSFGSTPGTPVVNGITFDGSLSGGLTRSFSGFGGCGGDFSFHFGGGLNSILSGCSFQPGGSSSMTLGGLNIGDEYTVQMLWANQLNTTGRNSRISTGGVTQNFAFSSGTPRNILTTFTATSATQLFSFGTGSTAEFRRFQLNAIVVSGPTPVPAPATLALLGIGLFAVGIRKRRVV